jgi:hypothetical protein
MRGSHYTHYFCVVDTHYGWPLLRWYIDTVHFVTLHYCIICIIVRYWSLPDGVPVFTLRCSVPDGDERSMLWWFLITFTGDGYVPLPTIAGDGVFGDGIIYVSLGCPLPLMPRSSAFLLCWNRCHSVHYLRSITVTTYSPLLYVLRPGTFDSFCDCLCPACVCTFLCHYLLPILWFCAVCCRFRVRTILRLDDLIACIAFTLLFCRVCYLPAGGYIHHTTLFYAVWWWLLCYCVVVLIFYFETWPLLLLLLLFVIVVIIIIIWYYYCYWWHLYIIYCYLMHFIIAALLFILLHYCIIDIEDLGV